MPIAFEGIVETFGLFSCTLHSFSCLWLRTCYSSILQSSYFDFWNNGLQKQFLKIFDSKMLLQENLKQLAIRTHNIYTMAFIQVRTLNYDPSLACLFAQNFPRLYY